MGVELLLNHFEMHNNIKSASVSNTLIWLPGPAGSKTPACHLLSFHRILSLRNMYLRCWCVNSAPRSGWHMAKLKETMWCSAFNILWTKPLSELLTYRTAVRRTVWAALNYQVKDITELRRTFAFILYLTTRGQSHLSFGLSCVSFRSGGNHRSSRGFYVQLFIYLFYFLLLTFWGRAAELVWGGSPPVPAAAENKLLCMTITVYLINPHKCFL